MCVNTFVNYLCKVELDKPFSGKKQKMLHMVTLSPTRRSYRHWCAHTYTHTHLQLCSRWVSGPLVNHTISMTEALHKAGSEQHIFHITTSSLFYCRVNSHSSLYFSFSSLTLRLSIYCLSPSLVSVRLSSVVNSIAIYLSRRFVSSNVSSFFLLLPFRGLVWHFISCWELDEKIDTTLMSVHQI